MKFIRLLSSKLCFTRDLPETLETLLRTFMNVFILKSVMLKAEIQLLKIDVTDKNLKLGDNIDIGMGAKLYVSTYKR